MVFLGTSSFSFTRAPLSGIVFLAREKRDEESPSGGIVWTRLPARAEVGGEVVKELGLGIVS